MEARHKHSAQLVMEAAHFQRSVLCWRPPPGQDLRRLAPPLLNHFPCRGSRRSDTAEQGAKVDIFGVLTPLLLEAVKGRLDGGGQRFHFSRLTQLSYVYAEGPSDFQQCFEMGPRDLPTLDARDRGR